MFYFHIVVLCYQRKHSKTEQNVYIFHCPQVFPPQTYYPLQSPTYTNQLVRCEMHSEPSDANIAVHRVIFSKLFSSRWQVPGELPGRVEWVSSRTFIMSRQRVCFALRLAVWRCGGEDRRDTQNWRRKHLSAHVDWFTTAGWKCAPQRVLSPGIRKALRVNCAAGASRGRHVGLLPGMSMLWGSYFFWLFLRTFERVNDRRFFFLFDHILRGIMTAFFIVDYYCWCCVLFCKQRLSLIMWLSFFKKLKPPPQKRFSIQFNLIQFDSSQFN